MKNQLDFEKAKDSGDTFGGNPISFFKLFRYANKGEIFLTITGALSSVLAGGAIPVMVTLFGNLTNTFVYNRFFSQLDNETLIEIFNRTPSSENVSDYLKHNYGIINFEDQVNKFTIGGVAIGIFIFFFLYLTVACLNSAAERQIHRIRKLFLKSVLKQELGWFDQCQRNDFASRFSEDLSKVQDGIGEKIGIFIFFATTCITSIVIAFFYGWKLTLVILLSVPLLTISVALLSKIQSSLTTEELKQYGRAGSIAEEVFSSIRTVFAFNGEEKEIERYEKNLIFARRAGLKRGLMTGVSMGVTWFIIYASYSLAFWYGTRLTLDSRPPHGTGEYDAEDLLVIFFLIVIGAMNIGQALPYISSISIAKGAAASVFEIIERKSALDATSTQGNKITDLKGNIEFRDVHFNYPTRNEFTVLQGINLHIKLGQTVAIVGPSGCGKSTCIQLIQRFYDPLKGVITLDGVDMRDLNLGWLRDQIGIVGQEPSLFATTIEENIRNGKRDASLEQIQTAAKEANAHDFIMKLPLNYKTHVGDCGVQISGGQKQRIAIARALVKKPKILLLDEATSALDFHSEAAVQRALEKARMGRTTVIVAHRLTTIRAADVIVAIEDGKVAEIGTHDVLMKMGGLYKKLVESQLSQYQCETDNGSRNNDVENACNRTNTMDEYQSDSTSNGDVNDLMKNDVAKIDIEKEVKSEEMDSAIAIPLSEILKWNAPDWIYIISGVICSCFNGVLLPIYAILFGEVLGVLSIPDEAEAWREANKLSIYFLILAIVAAICMFVQEIMFALSGENLTMRLRKRSFKTMLSQEMAWYDAEENNLGSLCLRLSRDASSVQGATGSRIGIIMQSISALAAAIIICMILSWKLSLVITPLVPILIVVMYYQSKVLAGQNFTENEAFDDAGEVALEAILNIRTVASLHIEEVVTEKYCDFLHLPQKAALKGSHIRGFAFGLAQGLPFIQYAIMMQYAIYLMKNEGLSYENIFTIGEALIFGIMMIGQSIAFAPSFAKAKDAASRLNNLFKSSKSETSKSSHANLCDSSKEISFSDIQFAYPTRPSQQVLKGLNIDIDHVKTVALVGASGCGKSTVMNLLERFYEPICGIISFEGENIQKIGLIQSRSFFGLVSQEPVLFDRTIAENIAYGDNARIISLEEIKDTAKKAHIHEFISSLPEGYETRVGSKGTQLSGGQKQRIAIARALIRNPKVLLLDEATSALDSESEKIVQEALEEAQVGRTCLVIAHRLSTIKNADKIFVLKGGVAVEEGTHDQLMAKKGEYFKLYAGAHHQS